MDDLKQRRYERKDSLNLVDYVVLDEGGEVTRRGIGRTLNLSEGGILLETHLPLDEGRRIIITLALEEDIVEMEGKVVYGKPSGEKGFSTGIEFLGVDEEGKQVLKAYKEILKAD